jgi:SulP family sulfate permease
MWRYFLEYFSKFELISISIVGHLKGYRWSYALADGWAGINVAMLAVPQGLAYAAIAGLPLRYGLISSIISCLVAPFFTASKRLILGPTNATALLLFSYFSNYNQTMQQRLAVLSVVLLMMSLLLIAAALLRLADLIQYVSRSVVVAYISGAALLIMINQGFVLLECIGLKRVYMEDGDMNWGEFINSFTHLQVDQFKWLILPFTAIFLYIAGKKMKPNWPIFALVLVVISGVYSVLSLYQWAMPTFNDEKFTLQQLMWKSPNLFSLKFWSWVSRFSSAALALAFLAALENQVMSRSLSVRTSEKYFPNQDLFTLGMTNLACSFFAAMPASGSLTRSALNFQSGAVSPLSGLFAGVATLGLTLSIGNLIEYLPKAVLAALIIVVALPLINWKSIRTCLRATGSDAMVFLTTFACTILLPLDVAIFCGVGLSVMLYLRKASKPVLAEYGFNEIGQLAESPLGQRTNPYISIVHIEGELFFAAADVMRNQLSEICRDESLKVVVLRFKNARHLDATTCMALEEFILSMRVRDKSVILSGVLKDIYRVLKNAGMIDIIGRENIFLASYGNPNVSTKKALQRASDILGDKNADVKIFYERRDPVS